MEANNHQSSGNRVEIVYDGECPVCSFLFERFLNLRRSGWDILLTDARKHPEVARRLSGEYGVDINHEFGICLNGTWHFGGPALHALFIAEKVQNSTLRNMLLTMMKLVYPALRLGRAALLSLLGRRKITY